jgi:broad specificity phosphatase PhoE
MLRILLVRHAEPQASPAADPQQWPLSEAGRRAAKDLGGRLPGTGLWVTSTEVKAHETLLLARPDQALPVSQDARFDEVRRVEQFDDDFLARRRAWVEGRLDQRHHGWEEPLEAATRFDEGISEYAALGSALVVGTHGMVLTAWLVHARGLVATPVAGAYWEAMSFPDVIEGHERGGRWMTRA